MVWTVWRLALVLVLATLTPGCGGKVGGATTPGPDAGNGNRADGGSTDPLVGFSEGTRAFYHLIVDGTVSDGRPRVYYAPKTMWLDRFGADPRWSSLVLSTGARTLGGLFDLVDTPHLTDLQQEADAAGAAAIDASLGIPHVQCGSSDILAQLSLLQDCGKAPQVISFGTVAVQASSTAAVATEIEARISRHLADGSAWDDIVVGDIAWLAPGGLVHHTKLEVSCIGGFDSNGSALLFDSPTCHARYP